MGHRKSATCLELATEGEQLCRVGEWEKAISCFKSALLNGTDDVRCLCAIYCQLGNAYLHQHKHTEALEFYRWYLTLSRRLKDTLGEVQACGNLGITLKLLGNYDEAVMCFNHQLDLIKHLGDQRLESRAMYNLANAYHVQGKWLAGSMTASASIGPADPSEFPEEATQAQRKAVEWYLQTLNLVQKLGDRSFEGRLYGHLGNSNYLLGNFQKAVEYHVLRLKFANEFGDVAAQRRAYSNMGNACIFLGNISSAADHYLNALQLAQQMNNTALEAQACYSLGNTFTILQEHETAVVYHLRHLIISRRLHDRVGEGRAHWSLSNLYVALGRLDLALRCCRRHRYIARQLHDNTGHITAQLTLRVIHDLMSRKNLPTATSDSGASCQQSPKSIQFNDSLSNSLQNRGVHEEALPDYLSTYKSKIMTGCLSADSGDQPGNQLISTPRSDELEQKMAPRKEEFDVDDDLTLDNVLEEELANRSVGVLESVQLVTLDEDGRTTTTHLGCLDVASTAVPSRTEFKSVDVDKNMSSSSQINEVPISGSAVSEVITATGGDIGTVVSTPGAADEELLDEQPTDQQDFFFTLLLDFQSRRMDEQRCLLRTGSGGLEADNAIGDRTTSRTQPSTPTSEQVAADEAFFDLIAGFQGNRMNDQRATLPAFPGLRLFDPSHSRHSRATGTLASVESGASDGLPEGDQIDSLRMLTAAVRPRPVSFADCSVLPRPHRDLSSSTEALDDDFLEMIFRLQTRTRINDQRSSLPDPVLSTSMETVNRRSRPISITASTSPSTAPTVPDEDFFSLIQRIQSARLDEQRCNPPPSTTLSTADVQNADSQLPGCTSSSAMQVPTSDGNRKPSSTSRRYRSSWKRLNSSTQGS